MKNFKITLLPIIFILLSSCSVAINTQPNVTLNTAETIPKNIALNGKIYSALWQQNSGEFRALCYQAYNIAKLRIDENQLFNDKKPLAIITDIDETFLDNSPYAVSEGEKGKDFDAKTWANWTAKASAKPYPGSLDFFNYVAFKKITVFYISNRDQNDKIGTLKNLKDLNFPFADEAHLLLRDRSSDKEARRLEVLKNYNVILYLGDNLADFSRLFNKRPQIERNLIVDEISQEFGKKFIMLPNSGYGDWESATPGFNYKMTPAQKDSVILKNVIGY